MSAAAGSAKKGNAFNEANEALYDYGGELPPMFEYLTEVYWPEWSDAELNAEVWDITTSKPTTGLAKGSLTRVPASEFFEEDEDFELPIIIKDYVKSWKRPHEVFPDAVLTVYDTSNSNFELRVPSPVANWDFFTHFNEQLPILQWYALKYGFPVEFEGPTFVSTTQGEPWRPWHHVYALCRAGKDQVHKPLYCRYGKYVVRLFYMGSWRRIRVDDRIPCDKNGLCMLPVTQVEGELWPIILAKAVLNIVSLTPTSDCSVIDLPFLSLFTGWTKGMITTINKTREQVWRRLCALSPRFELPAEDMDNKTAATSIKGSSKKEERKAVDKKVEYQSGCFLMGTLEGFSREDNLTESYKVGVSMIRDLPLVKSNPREPTKKWKRIRWIYWASEKGFWTDELQLPPYRRLQTICFVKELNKFLAPDPKEEAAMFEIPDEGKSEPSERPSSTSTDVVEPDQWSDFIKFNEYLLKFDVFFKPSVFPFTFRVSSLKVTGTKPTEGPSSVKTATKTPPPPQNYYFYVPYLKFTENEPLLLFCDSPTGLFLGISLWVSPRISDRVLGYLQSDQPEVLKVGIANVIVERFDWRAIEQGEILGMTSTVGQSSIGLSLKAGRHLLKLWISSEAPYVVDIFSNVEVTVYKGYKIRCMMTNESETIRNYINNISNAFLSLTQKFGKPDLPMGLRTFYETILPGNDRAVNYRRKLDDFIETFLNCILLSLKSLVPSNDDLQIMLWALRCLFVNPNIDCDIPKGGPPSSIYGAGTKKASVKKVVPVLKERTLSEILEYPWSPKEIAQVITIQKVFRGFRVRLLWKCQTPTRKEFKPFTDRLKKICDVMFVPQKRELEVGKLIRNIIMAEPSLFQTFKFYEDLPNVVQVEEFTGRIPNVEPMAWVPIARFIVACHADEFVPCSFHLSCNLEQYVIQGIDNDTNQRISLLTNSISPHYYQNNVRGYTICIFGWNDANPKTVNWRLEMVKMKHFHSVHLCNTLLDFSCHPYSIPNLETLEVKNFYVPNRRSRVCRCLIRVQKRTLLTLRLSASYPNVHFVVTIYLNRRFCSTGSESDAPNKIILQEYSSQGIVLLPSVILEYIEPSQWWGETSADADSTLYILEALILNNSWPLTKHEWGVVEPIRVNGENWKDSATNLQSKKSESRKRLSRTSKRSLTEQRPVENPFWLLQVLNDSSGRPSSGDSALVEEDRSYAESIKAMKISWEEKNPGRRKRGRDLRMKFLELIHLERNGFSDGEGIFGEGDRDSLDGDCRGDFKCLYEQMTNFSYLTRSTSPTRMWTSPRVLPPMPTQDLLNKYRISRHQSTSAQTSDFSVNSSSSSIKVDSNMVEETEEDRKEYLSQRAHYRLVLANYLNEEQKLSNKLMEEAYEARLKAIERMSR